MPAWAFSVVESGRPWQSLGRRRFGRRKPPQDRGRPARTIVGHSLAGVRDWERPATAPWVSLGLAVAFHAERPAAGPQGRSNAPRPPPRNKDAGETPAFPGGTPPRGGSDSWRKPPRDRGRPARTIAGHGLAGVRHWERPARAPRDSLGRAVAGHAERLAAGPQGRSNAPQPPPRNKDAGETPAFPGGTPPRGGSDSWRKPPRDRGRPARTIARHGLAGVRHWVRRARAPRVSLGPAVAVHAERLAAGPQGRSNAPRPPPRNKDAGETPAFPGGTPPRGGSDSWRKPPRDRGRPARTIVGHGLSGIRHWERPARAPRVSWDVPLRFTPKGRLPARKVAATLCNLRQETRMRARRPRSRGAPAFPGGPSSTQQGKAFPPRLTGFPVAVTMNGRPGPGARLGCAPPGAHS